MALIRKLGDYKFFPTSFTLDLNAAKQSVKGKLAPGRSDRSFVLLINPGINRSNLLYDLKGAAQYLQNKKPGCVDTVAIATGKKCGPALLVASVIVNDAETLPIISKKQLQKPLEALPYSVVYAPTSVRHWQDAYDDLRSAVEEIDDEDLPRGFIPTPLGALTVRESEEGVYAEIERATRYPRTSRFARPISVVEEDYFGAPDDLEDEESEDEDTGGEE
jgi:hypothetical protein